MGKGGGSNSEIYPKNWTRENMAIQNRIAKVSGTDSKRIWGSIFHNLVLKLLFKGGMNYGNLFCPLIGGTLHAVAKKVGPMEKWTQVWRIRFRILSDIVELGA